MYSKVKLEAKVTTAIDNILKYLFHAKFLLVITHGKHLQIKEQDK